jgi:hypothetical protein
MPQVDPLMSYRIGHMKGREARESGPRPKAEVREERPSPETSCEPVGSTQRSRAFSVPGSSPITAIVVASSPLTPAGVFAVEESGEYSSEVLARRIAIASCGRDAFSPLSSRRLMAAKRLGFPENHTAEERNTRFRQGRATSWAFLRRLERRMARANACPRSDRAREPQRSRLHV